MRGIYKKPEKARQLLRFDGMAVSGLMPTDIDAIIEHRGLVWVVFEAKYNGAVVPTGQRLALEHFVQGMREAGRHAMAVVVDHQIQDEHKDVYLRDLAVRECYTTEGVKWRQPKRPMTAREITEEYITFWDKGLREWS